MAKTLTLSNPNQEISELLSGNPISSDNLTKANELAFRHKIFMPLIEHYAFKEDGEKCLEFCQRVLNDAANIESFGTIYHIKGLTLKKLKRSRQEILEAYKKSYELENTFGALSYYQELTYDEPIELTDAALAKEAFEIISKTEQFLTRNLSRANAAQGLSSIQQWIHNYLGEHYYYGIGVAENQIAAKDYFQKATRDRSSDSIGSLRAQYNSAFIIYHLDRLEESLHGASAICAKLENTGLLKDPTQPIYQFAIDLMAKTQLLIGITSQAIADKCEKDLKKFSDSQPKKLSPRDARAIQTQMSYYQNAIQSGFETAEKSFKDAAFNAKTIKSVEANDNLIKIYLTRKNLAQTLSCEINKALILKHLIDQNGFDQYSMLYLEAIEEIKNALKKGIIPGAIEEKYPAEFFQNSLVQLGIKPQIAIPTSHQLDTEIELVTTKINNFLSETSVTSHDLEQVSTLCETHNLYLPLYSFFLQGKHYEKCYKLVCEKLSAGNIRPQEQGKMLNIAAECLFYLSTEDQKEQQSNCHKALEFLERSMTDYGDIDAALALCSFHILATPVSDKSRLEKDLLAKIEKLLARKKLQTVLTPPEIEEIKLQEMRFTYYCGVAKAIANPQNPEAASEDFRKIVEKNQDFDCLEYYKVFFWHYNFNQFQKTQPELFLQKMNELLQKLEKSKMTSGSDLETTELYNAIYCEMGNVYKQKASDALAKLDQGEAQIQDYIKNALKNYDLALPFCRTEESKADTLQRMARCYRVKTSAMDQSQVPAIEASFIGTLTLYINAAKNYKQLADLRRGDTSLEKMLQSLITEICSLLEEKPAITSKIKLNPGLVKIKTGLHELEEASLIFTKILDRVSNEYLRQLQKPATPTAQPKKPEPAKAKKPAAEKKGYYEELEEELKSYGDDQQKICDRLARAIINEPKKRSEDEKNRRNQAKEKITKLITENLIPQENSESPTKFGLLENLANKEIAAAKNKIAEIKATESAAQINAESERLRQEQAALQAAQEALQQEKYLQELARQNDDKKKQEEAAVTLKQQTEIVAALEGRRREELRLTAERSIQEQEALQKILEQMQQQEREKEEEITTRRQQEEHLAQEEERRNEKRKKQEKERAAALQRQEQKIQTTRFELHSQITEFLHETEHDILDQMAFQNAVTFEDGLVELFKVMQQKIKQTIATLKEQDPQIDEFRYFEFYFHNLDNSMFNAQTYAHKVEQLKEMYEKSRSVGIIDASLRLAMFNNGMWAVCSFNRDSQKVTNYLAEFAAGKTTNTTQEEDRIIEHLVLKNISPTLGNPSWMHHLKKDLQINLAKKIVDKLAFREDCEEFLEKFVNNFKSSSEDSKAEIARIKASFQPELESKFHAQDKFWDDNYFQERTPSANAAHPRSQRLHSDERSLST